MPPIKRYQLGKLSDNATRQHPVSLHANTGLPTNRMYGLHSILRRTHCLSTHHLFALDALPLVQTDAGKRLASWFLRHHQRYLTGATDPDTRIRDFQNQIIHVEDGHWGGAPRVAHQWYNRLQRHLLSGSFADAAHAAGILSHYFTDPLQPLHTGQTQREALVHRPLEWSVYHSYDVIRRLWIEDDLRIVFQLSSHPDWLASAMKQAARYSHQKFNLLVNSYRFDEGIEDPPAGLDSRARTALAELFGLAITGWARIIERAAYDAESVLRGPLPAAPISVVPMATAMLEIPLCWRRRRRHERNERRSIAALVNEYRRTGRLVEHLPAEVDIKQRVIQVHRDEQIYQLDRKRRAAEKLERAEQQLQAEQLSQRSAEPPIDERPATIPFAVSANEQSVSSIDQLSGLRSVDAKLLACTGFESLSRIASTEPRLLHSELSRFSLTDPGRRCLQGGMPPSLSRIAHWVQQAQQIVNTSRSA